MPFDLDPDLLAGPLGLDLIGSLLLVVALLVARWLAVRAIRRRTAAPPQLQRRWAASVRNVFLVLLVVGLVLIWAPQLRTFALSLTAVAVALVVATKELILCFSGSFLRASSRAFAIGDLIEVAGVRGEVADHNVFATTLHEVGGPEQVYRPTGQTLVVPNSVLLTQPVRNHGGLGGHAFHRFLLTFETPLEPFRHESLIRGIVERHLAPFRAGARAVAAEIERHSGAAQAVDAPALRFATSELGRQRVEVTLLAPLAEAAALEHAIARDVTTALQERAPAAASPPGAPGAGGPQGAGGGEPA